MTPGENGRRWWPRSSTVMLGSGHGVGLRDVLGAVSAETPGTSRTYLVVAVAQAAIGSAWVRSLAIARSTRRRTACGVTPSCSAMTANVAGS